VERYLQSQSRGSPTIAGLMYLIWQATQDEMTAAYTMTRDIYPVWRRCGSCAFATPELLVLGTIPTDEDMVCQTVIRADRLEKRKLDLWRRARSVTTGLLILPE
jgi:hypothetical protein